MRKPLSALFLAFLALLAVSCAASIPATVSIQAAKKEASPAEPMTSVKPELGEIRLVNWEQDTETDTDGTYAMVFRYLGGANAIVFVSIDSPDLTPAQKAAYLMRAVEASGDTSSSPMVTGVNDGIHYAAFKTVETSTRQGIIAGAILVRQLEGTPYLVTIVGKWPIEFTPELLMNFEDLAASVHLAGTPQPVAPRLDYWGLAYDPNEQLPHP